MKTFPPSEQKEDRTTRLRKLLEKEFSPVFLEIRDNSARHARHLHNPSKGQAKSQGVRGPDQAKNTHYVIALTSARFDGLSRIERHRLVNALLAGEFDAGLHALSLILKGEKDA